ncbi:MAG TPA: glycosyltransferase [Aliidongia sp.]|uniref:glycosyltransferase n=1 Tax=Aliidongia sp. TaxID=1914230 RepID=UPI002DDDA041|nr:glycosyltransferase [Aliidongia sp.]HEV2678445.1 glycosyltransferase [Aliidongia sp.]
MREIAVFRHNLFRISEPFITQQAQQLLRYKPLYLGRLRFGDAPAGAGSLAVQDLDPRWPLPRIGWQIATRSPRPYQRLLAGRRPALIHAHFGVEGVYALPLAARLNIPLVTTFHGFDATLSTAALLCSPAWANYPLFRRRLARQGDLFLCASSFIRERVLAMGFPEARTRVHYIGVDCQAIRPRDPAEETPTILHVARLVEVKGTQYLIRAVGALAARHGNVQLVIVGDGPLHRSLQDLAKSLGLEGRVKFLGALPHRQVVTWMRQAAVLVLPSVRTSTGRVEGLGMVLLEAAASGVPAVGSRIGGIPEGIIDGETGFLVSERDPAALASRLNDLLDDPALRRRMGAAARALVERQFDIRRQTGTLEDLYDAVLADRGDTP